MDKDTYINNDAILYAGVIDEIKKSGTTYQPIYEAFTNCLEAINLRDDKSNNGIINIKLYSHQNLMRELEFHKLIIEDNGIGFNDVNFERLMRYKDNRKGFNNKGSGRLQLIHFFNHANYVSVYKDENGKYQQREFTLSKSEPYLKKNSIIFHKSTLPSSLTEPITILSLTELIESNKHYNSLTANSLKNLLVSHYIAYFCANRDQMPIITIFHYDGNEKIAEEKIETSDIPQHDDERKPIINYSSLAADGKSIVEISKNEEFIIQSFKIESSKLDKNAIKLTNKKELVEAVKVDLNILSTSEEIDGYRYLFLVSSPYFEKSEGDVRGHFLIPTRVEFKKQSDLYSPEVILLDDIEEKLNNEILLIYDEIKAKKDHQIKEIERLKSMFMLNDETLNALTIHLTDSEDKILTKVYEAEAKVSAKKDAEIKKKIDELETLDTSSPNYEEEFEQSVTELVKQIPLQNRTALTHYVARRHLVLELFDKLLDKKLKVQSPDNRDKNEKLLHNLIFQQTTTDPEKSDLWLINEDFIYFKGTSESRLHQVQIDGIKILKDKNDLSTEELEFRESLGEDRYEKRPDILLFPKEGKCIIIEFKNPTENVAHHLNQINNYATLIRNFTKDQFQFETFYGYLIGENIGANDVRAHDSDFQASYHFDYIFRPSKTIPGLFAGRKDGSIYLEVLKYRTLLDRAIARNSIFINKIKQNII